MFYTITSTLPEFHGGRTKALLKRIWFMEKHFKEPHMILTTNYNTNYPLVQKRFIQRQILSRKTKLLNIYEWVSEGECFCFPRSKFTKKPKYRKTPIEISGLTHKISEKDENVVRYYDGERYVLYRKYHDINLQTLKFEDFMLPEQKHKAERREYNEYGYLHRISLFDKSKNVKLSDRLYNRNGEVYCLRHFKGNVVSHIALYRKGKIYRVFDDESAFFTYFYENVIEPNSKVFNDARILDSAILDVSFPIKTVFVIHSSHKNLDCSLKNRYDVIKARATEVDQYLVLTTHQRDEMMTDLNIPKENLTIIPHCLPINKPKQTQRQTRFLFLGRIDENKQVSHILKAFKKYKDAGYHYGLDIYGYGNNADLKAMKNEIKELNLSKDVKFRGQTHEPEKVFSQYAASILASQFEGFALSVMESVNNGCPVIAYDIRYGPRELIQEGENGHLVESQNIDDLAEKMKWITERPLKSVKLDKRFGLEEAKKNYNQLLKKLQ